jgi:hypothetical protein
MSGCSATPARCIVSRRSSDWANRRASSRSGPLQKDDGFVGIVGVAEEETSLTAALSTGSLMIVENRLPLFVVLDFMADEHVWHSYRPPFPTPAFSGGIARLRPNSIPASRKKEGPLKAIGRKNLG